MFIKFINLSRTIALLVLSFFWMEVYSFAKQERALSAIDNGALVSYRIYLAKDTFLLYEPVLIDLWVTNKSDIPFKWGRSPIMGWTIKDEKGKVYPLQISLTPGVINIEPGDSAGGITGFSLYGITFGLYPSHFPEGKYKVSYWCFGDSIMPLSFTVVKPSGEEAKAMELYLKSFPSMKREDYEKLSRPEFKRYDRAKINNLIKVADRYPKSVYSAVALYRAANTAWNSFADKELACRLSRRVIKEYSDPHGSALKLMQGYYESKKDMNSFRLELENFINSSGDSVLLSRLKRTLKGLEGEKR